MSVKLRRTPKSKKEKKGKLNYPLPEAIDGSQWDIRNSSSRREGLAELRPGGGGRLTVPLGGGEIERAMRIHEQAHAAITPRDPEVWDGVDPTVLELCEDRRVHHAMQIEGFDDSLVALGGLSEDMAIEWRRLGEDYTRADKARDKAGRSLKVIPPRAITGARVMAAYETGLWDSEYKAAFALDPEAAQLGYTLAKQFSGEKLRPFAEAKLAAEILCETFGTPGEPQNDEDEKKPGEGDDLIPVPSAPRFLEALRRLREGESGEKLPTDGAFDFEESMEGKARGWPTMEIVEKPKPLRMKVAIRGGFRKIPEMRGRALRQVYRLAQDGRVFRAKHPVRRRGGAVLIDCSGSMSLSSEDVEAILVAIPAALVATYCGNGSAGVLWIIARDGKRAGSDDLQAHLGGNVVDVPALEWLNQQRGPRYWVCDGVVTEHGDQQTTRVVAMCRELQRKGNVIRVPNVDTILDHEGWERI